METKNIPIAEAGSGRPVLVLHGGGGPFTVANIAAHFGESAHTLVPTHPGWNGVERDDSIAGIHDYAELYLQLLADRDLTDVVVIGSSLGGWIAADMAVNDTEHRVGQLVIIDGAGIEVEGEPIREFFGLTPREIAEYSWHDADKGYIDPSTLPPERIAAQRANMATMGAVAAGMHDPALQARLGEISVPTLVLWGDSDRVFTPGYGAAYAAMIPDARFQVIPEAGHLPQLEQPERTFAALDAFVSTGG